MPIGRKPCTSRGMNRLARAWYWVRAMSKAWQKRRMGCRSSSMLTGCGSTKSRHWPQRFNSATAWRWIVCSSCQRDSNWAWISFNCTPEPPLAASAMVVASHWAFCISCSAAAFSVSKRSAMSCRASSYCRSTVACSRLEALGRLLAQAPRPRPRPPLSPLDSGRSAPPGLPDRPFRPPHCGLESRPRWPPPPARARPPGGTSR